MSSEKPRTPVHRHPRVWWSRIAWQWPILVWIGVALLAWWLLVHGGDYRRINGMVEVPQESVAPLETGRLSKILVERGQHVQAGDVIAQMDTRLLDEEIATLSQELRQERADSSRQFSSARERLESEIRNYRIETTDAQKQLEVYEDSLNRLKNLVQNGLADPFQLADLRAQMASLRGQLKLYAEFEDNLKDELTDLETARQEAMQSLSTAQSGTSRLNNLKRRREEMTLIAHQSGVVSHIWHESGGVVQAGDPVVDIIIDKPARILAFMNENDTRPIQSGDVVTVEPLVGGQRFDGRIETVSPNMIALQDRASPLPQSVVRGRRLEIVPLEDVALTPGAAMVILLPTKTRLEVFFPSSEK